MATTRRAGAGPLRRRDEEGRDRTRRGGLLKLYLPLIYAPADERA